MCSQSYSADGMKYRVSHLTAIDNVSIPMGNLMPLSEDQIQSRLVTDYCGNVIYENGELKKVLVDGGYISFTGSSPHYHFYVKDHQGNNRVVLSGDGRVEESNHYYPFGGLFGESCLNTDPYKYNGKELDRMHGLNWYDYSARLYDPMGGGGFPTMDPLCEKYYSISPYVYCLNNPIKYIDPDGRDIVIWYRNKSGEQKYFAFNGQNGAKAPNNSFVSSVVAAYNYNVQNGGGKNLKTAAINNNINIGVVETDYDNKYQGEFIRFNPKAGLQLKDGFILSPATGLEHEASHAVKDKTGKGDSTPDPQYGTKEERSVIQGAELETAKANGELPKKHNGRSSHTEGKWVVTKSVTSNQELDKHRSEALRTKIDKFKKSWTSE